MLIQDIIFDVVRQHPNLWLRYWVKKDHSGFSGQGEYIELRSSFITAETLSELLSAGFKIESIKTQKINADAYSDILLMRKTPYGERSV